MNTVTTVDPLLGRRSLFVLSTAVLLLLGHAAIPLEQFILRGDDAYYYFKVALNYPDLGFWSFDGVHPTDGVHPLWAMLLTGIAQVLHWVGITDPVPVARIFVAITALFHFASCLVLFRLLSRKVSTGVAIAATGALLFSIGIVWARVWGMENSLYAFMLLSTVAYFHLEHLERATIRTSVVLGLLLGLTALARLNAGLLTPCLLFYWLLRGGGRPLGERLRLGFVTGVATGLVVVPYLLWNQHSTGHLLPISGAAKAVAVRHYLEANGIDTRWSLQFFMGMLRRSHESVQRFITSRAGDGLWIVGGRVLFRPDGAIALPAFLGVLAALVVGPCILGQPRHWMRFLRERLARLSPFTYLLVFAVLNAAISAILYPTQLNYAIVRWWLVESEIVLVVVVSVIVVAAASYVGHRFVPQRLHVTLVTVALLALVAFHAQETARYFFGKSYVPVDWNLSWNDESHAAAQWLTENVPADARVGSWNAGVLAYHARQRVTNLDGLINNYDLLPYLEQQRVSDYIRRERLDYLSDMESMFAAHGVLTSLALTEVYSHYSPFIRKHYRIYRVDY